MAAWCEAVGRALRSEVKVPEVCNFENHKCDNGDEHEGRQCNHFMPCLKHPIASLEMQGVRESRAAAQSGRNRRGTHIWEGFPKWGTFSVHGLHLVHFTMRQLPALSVTREPLRSGKVGSSAELGSLIA
jgi:hypothetical protein